MAKYTPYNIEQKVTLVFQLTSDPNLNEYDHLIASDGTRWTVISVIRKEVPPFVLVNPPPPALIWWEVEIIPRGRNVILAQKKEKLSELDFSSITFEKS